MHTLIHSLGHGTRILKAQPGFTAMVVLALGLGIGANCALFTVVNSLLLRPLPYRDAAELVEIAVPRHPPLESFQAAQSFSGVARFVPWGHSVQGPQGATNTYGFFVSPNLFAVLGVDAAVGRVFAPDETQGVVILGYDYWRRTSGDPSIIGQTLVLSGQPHTVVGVLPAGFTLSVRDGNLFVPGSGPDGRIVARPRPDARHADMGCIPQHRRERRAAAPGSGDDGAADHLRERRQSPAGARRGTAEGSGDPHRDWRRPGPPVLAADDRERAARRHGHGARPAPRQLEPRLA
jgi:hypothetical protein